MSILRKSTQWAGILGLATCIGLPATGLAADAAPASPHTVTANVGAVSNYLFRGLTQTWDNPALQAGVDYSHATGWYAGLWASSISDKLFADGWAELDLYGGFNGKFNDDWTWTLGGIGYVYPGANYNDIIPAVADQSYNTFELNAGVGYKWITAKVSVAVTDYFGANKKTGFNDNSKGTTYLDLTANVPLPESIFTKDVTMPLHVGYTNFSSQLAAANAAGVTNPDYADFKIGIAKAFEGGISLSAAYLYADNGKFWDNYPSAKKATDLKDQGGDNFVLALTKTF
ncbi:MAG: hypothetical protein HQL99_06040 [Magnetococcales bacterium]|nr:hypothetical protein [Magnetococcales bacterium]